MSRLWELARLFAKLGTIGFGGPAAHIALMEDEVVARRGWLSREQFLDLLGATYLIPGPNAVEMAAYVGYRRAGSAGLLVGAVCFTLPATLITAVLGWLYVEYGRLPAVEPFLAGVKPAVLAIILVAVVRFAKTALAGVRLAAIGVGVAVASLGGAGELASLAVGTLLGTLLLRDRKPNDSPPSPDASHAPATDSPPPQDGAGPAGGCPTAPAGAIALAAPPTLAANTALATNSALAAGAAGATAATTATGTVSSVSLSALALYFLKIGAVLYGSGYVLIAYLEGEIGPTGLNWLSERQLLDAVAAGQFTPGPLLTTATFIGYLLAGWPGAVVATAAIVAPSLVFVWATGPWLPRMRRSPLAGRFLDAVSAASVGLTAAVFLVLAYATLYNAQAGAIEWRSVLVAVASGLALWRWQPPAALLVLGGAVLGRLLACW